MGVGEGDILKVMYSDAGILVCQGRSRGAPTQPLSTLMRGSLTQPSKGVKDRRCPDCPTNPGVPWLLQLVAMWNRMREDSVRTGGGGRAEVLQSSPRPPVRLALGAGCRLQR